MNDIHGDPLLGKVVIDISRKYMSIYLCEGDGTVKDAEHVRYPQRLEVKEARQETRDMFDLTYQWALDVLVSDELQEGEGGQPDSV